MQNLLYFHYSEDFRMKGQCVSVFLEHCALCLLF